MCAELSESAEGRKSVHVTVRFEPSVYSRLVLLAHRHQHSLGDEIRIAAKQYIERHDTGDEVT
jgi:predicted HicB family RNase H-like nuclease